MTVTRRWQRAKIKQRDGEELVEVDARVWRTTQQVTSGGERYDYRGVCEIEARDHLIGRRNRLLEFVEGPTYRVQDAIYWPTLGYVELHLIQVSNEA